MTKSTNIIREKAFSFAEEIIHVCKEMTTKKEFVLSKQLMKSGTSIGANIEEAMQGQSKNDFISKMNIALKEAYETRYWIRLIVRTGYMQPDRMQNSRNEIENIIRILVAIIRTAKSRAQ
ncbi:four helix bundle protein [Candidatus Peribacteria bacterium]|nr:four helix bundle protein [Candidatus Peribacteria bacterium]